MDQITAKDVWLLVAGVLFGGFAGVLFAITLQPVIEDKLQFFLARMLGGFGPRSGETIEGKWLARWWEDNNRNSPEDNEYELHLQQFGKSISGRFSWGNRHYYLKGSFESDTFITGKYYDTRRGRVFFGAFQLQIHPNVNTAIGKWVGFNSNNRVISGTWEWRRSTDEPYPTDRGNAETKRVTRKAEVP